MKTVFSVLALFAALALAGCGSPPELAERNRAHSAGSCTTFFAPQNSGYALHYRYDRDGSASAPSVTELSNWRDGCAPASGTGAAPD